jgi:hypothetical protein
MHKLVPPLIGVVVSGFLVYQAATSMPQPLDDRAPPKTAASERKQETAESPHKAVVRFLGDLDDQLDTVHDRASFVAIKPRLLARTRQHAALAVAHADQGLTQLSPTAAEQWQAAANRLARSLARATQAVSEVETFFAKELAPLLSAR